MSLEGSALILAWIAIALLSFAVAGLHRQLRIFASGGRPRRGIGPPPGMQAPALHEELAEVPGTKMLLFVDMTCASCIQALAEAGALAARYSQVAFVAVFEGEANGYDTPGLHVVQNAREAFSAFGVTVRPLAVLVDAGGSVIQAKPVGGKDALRGFAKEATRAL